MSSIRIDDLSDLPALFSRDLNLAVLERDPDAPVFGYAQTLTGRGGELFMATVEPGAGALDGLEAALPAADGRALFVADVARWAEVLADLTGAPRVGVRLVSLTAPMCPRFHVDNVTVRLVTTYVGPGTEWLDDADVDRRWLARGPDETSGLLRDGATVQSCRPFDLAFMKGEAWPTHHARGVVHRSPAGCDEARPRLVLTLDPLD
jgi:hypothetical protein